MNYAKGFSLILFLLMMALQSNGQLSETINSDRPGQAISATTVGKKVFQIQKGIGWMRDKGRVWRDDLNCSLGTETVLRFGVLDRFEINTLCNMAILTKNDEKFFAFDALHLGFRAKIFDGKKWIPQIAVQYQLITRAVSDRVRQDRMGSRITMATKNVIREKWSLATNLGIEWDGNGRQHNILYMINCSYAISDKFLVFLEHYATANRYDMFGYVDYGMAWLLNKNLQLDLFGGYNRTYQSQGGMASIGVSWRVVPKESGVGKP